MTTINLEARPFVPGNPTGMSASSSANAARGAASWVMPGAWRTPSAHRADDGPGPATRGFLLVAALIAWFAVTLWNVVRRYGWSLGAAGAFTAAGFTVSTTRGLVIAGVALLVLEWRTRE